MADIGPTLQVAVPASIANLGPGFDTLAVAVRLYLRLEARPIGGQGELHFDFTGGLLDGENYIERAFRFLAVQSETPFDSLAIRVESEIPMKSGLGSSAAATVAGLRLFEATARPLSQQGLLNAACALEHHPDNVAAALLGGLTCSCQLPDRSVAAVQIAWPEELKFIVLTPDFPLATSQSRGVLPCTVAREDAVFNLQRVALLIHCLQAREYGLLREALSDRLHQPYRQHLVPGLERALSLQHPNLLGACLSGAGPSIVALAVDNVPEVVRLLSAELADEGLPYAVRVLEVHP